jgi:hypothetical protein
MRMYFKDIEWEGADWIKLVQDMKKWRSEQGNEPSSSMKLWEIS